MCNCLPGSEENFWFEVRDPKCVQDELVAFGRAMEMVPEFIARLRLKE